MVHSKEKEEKTGCYDEKLCENDQAISRMNHELRTPFAGIMGYSSLLAQGNITDPEKIKKAGRVIYRNASELLKMIDNMMIFVKGNLSHMTYHFDHFMVGEFLESMIDMYMPLFTEKQIHFQVNTGNNEWYVYGDSSKVRLVLVNLLSNALKFTPHGGQIYLNVESYGEQMLSFTIGDTGIGITPEEQEKIFEPYYQSQEALEMGQRGLGLGLNIVKEFVERMGGEIWVESKKGEGSKFIFTLPLYED